MYTLNPDAARKADERAGRISEIGKYVGTFLYAENVVSEKKGTRGVEFAFETEGKQGATFALWTLNKDGKELFGLGLVNSIMTCLRVKSITPTKVVIRKYDRFAKGMANVEAEVFKELMGKPIGVLFETEDYRRTDGSIGVKIVPAGFFDAMSELTASEILDKKVQPLKLAQAVRGLKHRPLRNQGGGASQNMGHPNAPGNDVGGGFEDDDIPF